MSVIKPIIRETKQAVLTGMAHSKDKLHQLTDNMNDHLDNVVKQVRDKDKFDTTTTRGRNEKVTHWDPNSGRPVSERGRINEDFGSSDRGDNATAVGNLGTRTDDGGHLGAHRFFGDTPDEGIVPQAANLNRGAWKKMENEWADWVGKGFQVDYNIDVNPPGAVRPDSFDVEYTVTNPATGEVVHRNWPEFENVDGQSFDRVPRRDMPEL
ncbi:MULTISPECIES: DNA/RNA non-specific endonuclease [unclassified Microbacterium]|uniref:DNA/RNA non-specific endonuclease n=1 Tax=unclassified Microbacterium TaxID=2609290 RepID=UPI000EA86BB8|nr:MULTISPECIES: DNA/RNA non-specific endonuclease [unclassified Microbacterium]MBT2484543.1 DNA/RNA non-specific endonuclease [Microbacterium sp. ISL-108]RKN67444.1 hypothetical protein D7252_07520 [Microbacterium sp. CGR2]